MASGFLCVVVGPPTRTDSRANDPDTSPSAYVLFL
jgi:hypothetical protein